MAEVGSAWLRWARRPRVWLVFFFSSGEEEEEAEAAAGGRPHGVGAAGDPRLPVLPVESRRWA